ncbi:MAG: hypothetical protein WD423_09920 [Rhodothermales bacterium]
MNVAHIHILLVHLPVLGAYFGLVLLLYGWAFKKQEALRISFGTFFVAGLFSVIVYLTGGAAEEIVEDVAGVTHDIIEAHEDFAVAALVSGIVLGLTGVVGLLVSIRRTVIPRWLTVTVVVIGIVTAGIMARTAYLGGQINHPEIRSDQETVQASVPATDESSGVSLPPQ